MSAVIPARNRFPVIGAAVLAIFIVICFARTYYLKFLFHTPPLTLLAQVHGFFATVWLGLHYTQAKLIAARRVDLHRKLGIFGAVVGALLAVQAIMLALAGAAAGRAPPGRDPLQFLSVPFGTTTIFAALLVGALAMRRRRDWHRRLMLLATLALIVPAAGRLDLLLMAPLGLPRRWLAVVLTAAFLVWACFNDFRRERRVHPAYLYGGLILLVSIPLRAWIGTTGAWQPIAHWLVPASLN